MSDQKTDLDRIKVLVRVRSEPLGECENAPSPVTVHDSHSLTVTNAEQTKTFDCSYDVVLGQKSTQEDVYNQVRDTTKSVMEGVNATVFAYGTSE